MLWRTAVIAKQSLYTGFLQPAASPSSSNVVELLTAIPPVPTPASVPPQPNPPPVEGRLTPGPARTGLQVQIAASTASVLFIGESLHYFYDNRLIELPTPLGHASSVRVTYRSLQDSFSMSPEMNGRAMSVCFVAFGRRLFISGKVRNTITDPTMIILRPDSKVEFRLPSSFRSPLRQLLAFSRMDVRFFRPEITLGVAGNYDLANPRVDNRAPWTGFLSFGTDTANPLFVRASAVQFIVCNRERIPVIGRLPPILHFPRSSIIRVAELPEFMSFRSAEWLGVFLLKDELGQTANNPNIQAFQRDIQRKGLAYHIGLEANSLVVWCQRLRPGDNEYNFVFGFIPYEMYGTDDGANAAVPNSASDPVHRIIPRRETPREHNMPDFVGRMERNIDDLASAIPTLRCGDNSRRVNQLLRARQTEGNPRMDVMGAQAGSLSQAPHENGSARTNGAGPTAGNTSSIEREIVQTRFMRLRTSMRTSTRTNVNPVGLRGLTTPSTAAPNNSNIFPGAGLYYELLGPSTDPARANNQVQKREMKSTNAQSTTQNPSTTVTPASGQGVRPTSRAGSSSDLTRTNNQSSRQVIVIQRPNLPMTSQNLRRSQRLNKQGVGRTSRASSSANPPRSKTQTSSQRIQRNNVQSRGRNPSLAQPSNTEGASQTNSSAIRQGERQNGKRSRPSQGHVTSQEMQPPATRARLQNQTNRTWGTEAADLPSLNRTVLRPPGQNPSTTPLSVGLASEFSTRQRAVVMLNRVRESSRGQAARSSAAVRQGDNERPMRVTTGPSSTLAGRNTVPPISMNTRVPRIRPLVHALQRPIPDLNMSTALLRPHQDIFPDSIQITYSVQEPQEPCPDPRNPLSTPSLEESYFENLETVARSFDEYFMDAAQRRTPAQAAQADAMRAELRARLFEPPFLLPDGSMRYDRFPTLNSRQNSAQARSVQGLRPESWERHNGYGLHAPDVGYPEDNPPETLPLSGLADTMGHPSVGVAEWQILYGEAPPRPANDNWRVARLFPNGPFVGSLPRAFVSSLFHRAGRNFDGCGFRFWRNGHAILVFCSE